MLKKLNIFLGGKKSLVENDVSVLENSWKLKTVCVGTDIFVTDMGSLVPVTVAPWHHGGLQKLCKISQHLPDYFSPFFLCLVTSPLPMMPFCASTENNRILCIKWYMLCIDLGIKTITSVDVNWKKTSSLHHIVLTLPGPTWSWIGLFLLLFGPN